MMDVKTKDIKETVTLAKAIRAAGNKGMGEVVKKAIS